MARLIEKVKKEWEKEIDKFSKDKINEVTNGDYNGISINCYKCDSLALIVRKAQNEWVVFNDRWANRLKGKKLSVQKKKDIIREIKKGELKNLTKILAPIWDVSSNLNLYCNRCNKVYCEDCYSVSHDFDEGFIESTYHICPKGHRRMVD